MDVCKAFDKVWHEGLTFKIKQVILNDMISHLCFLEAGVPQGSILGPFLFLIFINDIVDEMECHVNLFALRHICPAKIIDILTSFDKVNRDLQRLTGFGK